MNKFKEIYDKLKSFYNLKRFWNGEKTYAPDGNCIFDVQLILNKYEKFIENNNLLDKIDVGLYPINSGGIGIEIVFEKYSLEIDIKNNNNMIEYLYENDYDYDILEEETVSKSDFINNVLKRLLIELYK